VTLVVDRPNPDDEIIIRYAEPERLTWIHANLTDHAGVAALGRADSYATRPSTTSAPAATRWHGSSADCARTRRRSPHSSRTPTLATSLRQPARLLAAGRRSRADRPRAQHRLGAKGYGDLVELATQSRYRPRPDRATEQTKHGKSVIDTGSQPATGTACMPQTSPMY
jgi:hypothetical protein